jgi:hypothetical protein
MKQDYYSLFNRTPGLGSIALNTNRGVKSVIKDQYGNRIEYAHVWPEGKPSEGVYTLESGTFHLPNVPQNSNIVVSYQGNAVTIPVSEVGLEIVINTTQSLDEVVVTNKKDNTLLYVGLGVLAIAVIYAMTRSKNKPVKAVI